MTDFTVTKGSLKPPKFLMPKHMHSFNKLLVEKSLANLCQGIQSSSKQFFISVG